MLLIPAFRAGKEINPYDNTPISKKEKTRLYYNRALPGFKI